MNKDNNEMRILLNELSTTEQVAFHQVMASLRNEHKITEDEYSPNQIFRFFRGNEKNPSKSIEAIMNNIRWRRSQPMEKAKNLDIKRFDFGYKHVKMGFYGSDFNGHPIRIIQPSNFDPRVVLDYYSEEERYLFALQYLERNLNVVLPAATLKSGKYINGMISIVDLKELNIKRVLWNFSIIRDYQKHAQDFQDNFPEMCTKTILINANLFVSCIWPLAKLFIKKETRDKFIFLGNNYMPELLKYTTKEKLPVSLGGTCELDINNFPDDINAELARSIEDKRFRLK
jgi:hypothetical protein